MRNLTIYVTLVLLCTIVFTGQSADIPQKDEPSLRDLLGVDISQQPAPEKQKPKFVVEVLVECDDENTKAFIESHIKRELRSLQDVEIATVVGEYQLKIVAEEFKDKASGQKLGTIALACEYVRIYNPSGVINKLMDIYPVGTDGFHIAKEFNLIFLYDKTGLSLASGMTDHLDKICKDIVVNFDTGMLEPDRNRK